MNIIVKQQTFTNSSEPGPLIRGPRCTNFADVELTDIDHITISGEDQELSFWRGPRGQLHKCVASFSLRDSSIQIDEYKTRSVIPPPSDADAPPTDKMRIPNQP